MQENIRPIAPIGISGLQPQIPPTGMPIFELVKPTDLYVDPAYQRNISEKGMRQIRRIIEGFDWTSFKPPICAYGELEGRTILKVLDGQHTAIAAASNPHITEIPVMIVEARNTVDQAKAFIGQNTGRLAVTPLQLHQAAIASANEDAQTLELVCARANVRIMTSPNAYTGTGARQTIAVKQIEALIARRGPMFAREILEVLANAEIGPLTASQIKAVELLMTEPKYCDFVLPDDITIAMVDLLSSAEEEAKIFSASHKLTLWKALAITWFQKAKKRKQPLARVA